MEAVNENTNASGSHFSHVLQTNYGIEASARTVHRTLKRLQYKKLLDKKILFLTEQHKEGRVVFCNNNINRQWHNVFISDESVFQLHDFKVRSWSHSGRRKIPAPKFSPKLMVWGAISQNAAVLTFINGNVDSVKYCQILNDNLIPIAQRFYPNGQWFLQQDGARPHTSIYTQRWFNQKEINVIQWPPNSADLSPIENVWSMVKNFVRKRYPTTMVQLRTLIREGWDHYMTRALRRKLIFGINKRLRKCIELRGEIVK
jgi:hypothetical protein